MKTTHYVQTFYTYLEAMGRSPKTIEAYRYRLRLINEKDLSDWQPEDIDHIIVSLRRSTRSQATIAGHIQAIRTFFRWCVDRGYLQKNPAAHLHPEKPRPNADVKAMPQSDLERMIVYAKSQQNKTNYAMLRFLADTGCRVGELCNLRIEHVNFQENEATVYGKTGEHIVDFTVITGNILRKIIGKRTSGYVFLSTRKEKLSIHSIYARFRWIARQIGAKKFNPHAIRHRVGQAWIDQGVNLEILRQKLGHKDIHTTAMYYAHQDRARIKAASQKFSILKGQPA